MIRQLHHTAKALDELAGRGGKRAPVRSLRGSFREMFAHRASGSPTTPAALPLAPSAGAASLQAPNPPIFITPPAPPAAPTAPAAPAVPTAGPPSPVFKASWEQNVTGVSPYGMQSGYNSTQFATAETTDHYAAMLGGQVKENTLQGFTRTAPERLIVGAGANPLNAGLVADLFAKYGSAPGSEAWRVINQDLGRTGNS